MEASSVDGKQQTDMVEAVTEDIPEFIPASDTSTKTVEIYAGGRSEDVSSPKVIEETNDLDIVDNYSKDFNTFEKINMCGEKVENKENLPKDEGVSCDALYKADRCSEGGSDKVGNHSLFNKVTQCSCGDHCCHKCALNSSETMQEEDRENISVHDKYSHEGLSRHSRINGFIADDYDVKNNIVTKHSDLRDHNFHNFQKHEDNMLPYNVSVTNSNGINKFLNTATMSFTKRQSDESNSDTEVEGNSRPSSTVSENSENLMKFAEVLYKCTLCTTIPSILTSKSSFLQHVNSQHLVKKKCVHFCTFCDLNFQTEEDLKEHILNLHPTGSSVNVPCDKTASDVMDTLPESLVDNDSDSDSSGHRQLKTKIAKWSKPLQDFEEPKQLVDHAGIETSDGSLDLSRKEMKENQSAENQNGHSKLTYPRTQTPKVKEEVNLVNVQQITDQILKSNSHNQHHSANSSGPRLSFTPSFTAEFGKYTKLVREGGNIVYFCQVCNWKSPVKSAFHLHCGSSSHKSKVASAEDPDSTPDQLETNCQMDTILPSPCVQTNCPNVSVPSRLTPSRDAQICWPLTFDRSSSLSESAMFYNYMRQTSFMPTKKRTPVVTHFKSLSDNSSNAEDLNKDLSSKKRKKGALLGVKNILRHRLNNSDSDSDGSQKGLLHQEHNDYNQVWKSQTPNMPLMRSKLLNVSNYTSSGQLIEKDGDIHTDNGRELFDSDTVKHETADSGENGNRKLSKHGNSDSAQLLCRDGDLKSGFSKDLNYIKRENAEDPSSRKRKNDSPLGDVEHATKTVSLSGKFPTERGDVRTALPDRGSLFKLYRCHACSYEYSNIEEYESHFERVHKTMGTSAVSSRGPSGSLLGQDSGTGGGVQARNDISKGKSSMDTQGSAGNFEVGENWRVQKLKDILPQFLLVNDKGNTSRDYLLQCISLTTGHNDAPLWSSACNKAMREVFPSSLAQRKGKYKRTYYFGVAMVDQFQYQEEVPPVEPDGPVFQSPLRDVNYDMEKIIEHLPDILCWNGCMDAGIYRGDILVLLADKLKDQDVVNWGAQCNRAIRLVFPKVDMKRKGKFKTMYFGVTFQSHVLKDRGDYPNFWTQFGDRAGTMTENDIPGEESQRESTLARRQVTSPAQEGDMLPEFETGQTVFPQWFRNEARRQMDQYLAKFGGVTMYEEGSSEVTNGEENDGDDEEDSLESSVRSGTKCADGAEVQG